LSYNQTILDRVMSNMKRYKIIILINQTFTITTYLYSLYTFQTYSFYFIVKIFEQFQSFLESCQIHFAYLLNDLVMLDEVIETISSKYV